MWFALLSVSVLSHSFLAVGRFRLLRDGRSLFSVELCIYVMLRYCVFMLSNALSKSIVLIKGKTHCHVESAEAKLFPFSCFKYLSKCFGSQ